MVKETGGVDGSDDFSDLTEQTGAVLRDPSGEVTFTPGPAGNIRVEAIPGELHPRLEVIVGAERGKVYLIEKPLVMLGRTQGVVEIVTADHAASRHHAAIGYCNGEFKLYDLGSTNGTFVGDKQIDAHVLQPGDEIRIGETRFQFQLAV